MSVVPSAYIITPQKIPHKDAEKRLLYSYIRAFVVYYVKMDFYKGSIIDQLWKVKQEVGQKKR